MTDDDRPLTDAEKYAAAERIAGMFPDGLIAFLLAEYNAMRNIVEWLDSELPDYQTLTAIREKARALLGGTEE